MPEYVNILKDGTQIDLRTPQYGMQPPIPCRYCKHINWEKILCKPPPGEPMVIDGWTVYTCKAFPDGIPKALHDGNTHETEIPGDNGVRFEKHPAAPTPPWKR